MFLDFDQTIEVRVEEFETYDQDLRDLTDSHLSHGDHFGLALFAVEPIFYRQVLDQCEILKALPQVITVIN